MAHAIEQFADGTSAFFTAREPAWHKLGVVTDDALTAEQALETAKLAGWNLRKTPVQTVVETPLGDMACEIEGKWAVVRDNPVTGLPDALGVVGDGYHIVSNEDAFAFLDNLVDEGGAHFETAGSLHNGKRVFLTMKMPKSIVVGDGDRTDLYLAVTNAHDGTGAFEAVVTPVRIVCQNTLTAGLRAATNHWKIRHTSSANGRIAEARRALDLTFRYADEFETVAQQLAATPMRDMDFGKLTSRLFPLVKDATDRQKTANDKTRGTLMTLFREAPTQENIRGTKWAAFNAIAEWADWAMPVRGGEEARPLRNMTYSYVNDIKSDALSMLVAA